MGRGSRRRAATALAAGGGIGQPGARGGGGRWVQGRSSPSPPHPPCRHHFLPPLRGSPHLLRKGFWVDPGGEPAPAHSGTDLQSGRAVRVPDAADPLRSSSRVPAPRDHTTQGLLIRATEPLLPRFGLPAEPRPLPAHAPPTPPDGQPCGPIASSWDLPFGLQALIQPRPTCARSPAPPRPAYRPMAERRRTRRLYIGGAGTRGAGAARSCSAGASEPAATPAGSAGPRGHGGLRAGAARRRGRLPQPVCGRARGAGGAGRWARVRARPCRL